MNQPFVSDDYYFTAALLYTYGFEVLTQISLDERGRATFTADAPEEDVAIFFDEYNREVMALSSVKSYGVILGRLTGLLRAMKRNNETQWVSNSWINGKTPSGRKIK
jgi:hypothetical protein